ncbi:Peroxidase 5 [Acorus gramineus]|uniref:Peroxidase n=1 Tax=Acorus gramineus TaxID=55184 RepID=A0AAV9BNU0_ACOGR|nr:Peroxidase 5 [Acorus gramineus]
MLFSLIFLCTTISSSMASLQLGFYQQTCPLAESIVRLTVTEAVAVDPGLAPALLRMHFHDCFVRGCDGSVLLESTPTNPSERESPANKGSLRGFEVIDITKANLEWQCPQTVSCADILAFAARDAVLLTGGIEYALPSGRRDGRVSSAPEVVKNLPSPVFDAEKLAQNFASKGFTRREMVTLSGAHSFGVSHCSSFVNRLYSFNATHAQDPSMDPSLAARLRSMCPGRAGGPNPTVPFVNRFPHKLDNKYYRNLKKMKGLLTSDQTLLSSQSTAGIVWRHAKHHHKWTDEFAAAMVKLGSVGVLTGDEGEVRKNCGFVN